MIFVLELIYFEVTPVSAYILDVIYIWICQHLDKSR